jgi:hypothetical protein
MQGIALWHKLFSFQQPATNGISLSGSLFEFCLKHPIDIGCKHQAGIDPGWHHHTLAVSKSIALAEQDIVLSTGHRGSSWDLLLYRAVGDHKLEGSRRGGKNRLLGYKSIVWQLQGKAGSA